MLHAIKCVPLRPNVVLIVFTSIDFRAGVFSIALGCQGLIDQDALRHDPVLGVVLGRLEARRPGCALLAGKSTLNWLEHAPSGAHSNSRIGHDAGATETLFVDFFLDAHGQARASPRAATNSYLMATAYATSVSPRSDQTGIIRAYTHELTPPRDR